MTRYVPVIAFVPADDVATLQPFVTKWAADMDRSLDKESKVFLRMSGATYEQVAWGSMLSDLADGVRTGRLTVEMIRSEPEERG